MPVIITGNIENFNNFDRSVVTIKQTPEGTTMTVRPQDDYTEDVVPTENINQEETFESDEESRRGPKVTSLFISNEVERQETERLISFLHEHKLGKSDLDAAQDNSANQVIVCFYRVWKENHKLTSKAGPTALVRYISTIEGLSISVTEIAYSNALGRMIKPENKYPNWSGLVREYFQMN